MQYKSLDAEIIKTVNKEASPIVSFIASTSSPDRYGDVINQAGWSLSKYRKNPVILLNHNANQLPIGRGEVDVIDGQLMVDIEFDMNDPIAAEVARKTEAGFMSAVSVGFNPIESTPRSMLAKDSPFYGKRGEYFERAELLEISIVTIPANGEAVAAKNYIGKNTVFKLSELKHIIDVETDGDKVIVTYLLHEDKEMREDDQEEDGYRDEESEEMAMNEDEEDPGIDKDEEDEEDEEEEKSFLTNQERDLFAFLTNGENTYE